MHEGYIEEGIVLCVVSYRGLRFGGEGLKLEHQLVLRKDGPEILSRSLFDPAFLS